MSEDQMKPSPNQGKHPPCQPTPPDSKPRDDLPEHKLEDVKDHEP